MKEILKNILREESVQYITGHYPNIRLLASASEKELQQIPYVGPGKAKELKAIFDISKSLLEPDTDVQHIKSPDDAYKLLKIMSTYEEERMCIILLDTKNKVIDQLCISKGSLNSSIVHPREIYSPAIRNKAAGIILAHNHPSQDKQESSEDVETTIRIRDAGNIIGIKLFDSIIITNNGYTSLKEKGVI